jgi:TonB family protein
MKVAILLFCSALAFGQDASSTPRTESLPPPTSVPEEKQSAAGPNGFKKIWTELTPGAAIQQATQAAAANRAPQLGALDILSNTYGIDFGPYLQALVKDVRKKWFSIIPASDQMKKGKLAIQFDIAKDGKVADMRLVTSSGDRSLDRYAWGSITASNPFPSLPREFQDSYLRLRFRYYYNPDKRDLNVSAKDILSEPTHTNKATPMLSKSGIAVNISSLGDIYVPAGESKTITATVTGTKEQALEWSVNGPGCSASSCGNITGDVYIAPTFQPNPPVVTLTATSKADPTAKATVNVHIVQPSSKLAPKP